MTRPKKRKNSFLKYIKTLGLKEHPEGGYYREIYRSQGRIQRKGLPKGFCGERRFMTSIYYLLKGSDFSAFHRLRADELWFFLDGSALLLHVLEAEGKKRIIRLGRDAIKGDVLQAAVPAGCCFAAEPEDKTSYSLAGCAVAPGFDFQDFEMCRREDLVRRYPRHRRCIIELTR